MPPDPKQEKAIAEKRAEFARKLVTQTEARLKLRGSGDIVTGDLKHELQQVFEAQLETLENNEAERRARLLCIAAHNLCQMASMTHPRAEFAVFGFDPRSGDGPAPIGFEFEDPEPT